MSFITTAARMWLTKTFKPFTFENEYDNRLFYADTSSLGLYIHIPFCRSLCPFCPYCKVTYEKTACDEYVNALIQEIRLVGGQTKGKKRDDQLLFWGRLPCAGPGQAGRYHLSAA